MTGPEKSNSSRANAEKVYVTGNSLTRAVNPTQAKGRLEWATRARCMGDPRTVNEPSAHCEWASACYD
jgi:hypothetical protein